RDIGTGFLAHEICEPARQLAFVRAREVAEQHVGDDEAEHVVTQEFEPLVARPAALTHSRQRRHVGQRLLEQRRILETMTDALLELPCAPPPASRLLRPGGACPVALSWWRLRGPDALALRRTAHRRTAHRMIEKNRLRR